MTDFYCHWELSPGSGKWGLHILQLFLLLWSTVIETLTHRKLSGQLHKSHFLMWTGHRNLDLNSKTSPSSWPRGESGPEMLAEHTSYFCFSTGFIKISFCFQASLWWSALENGAWGRWVCEATHWSVSHSSLLLAFLHQVPVRPSKHMLYSLVAILVFDPFAYRFSIPNKSSGWHSVHAGKKGTDTNGGHHQVVSMWA